MPNKTTLTDTFIRNLSPPETGSKSYWDAAMDGLGIRVSQGGTKTFIVFIAEGRRQRIGRYPNMKLAAARQEAKTLLAERVLGRRRPKQMPFEDAKNEFLAALEGNRRPKTIYEYRRVLNRHFRFKRKSIGDITDTHLNKALKSIDKRREREYAYVVGNAFFNWCLNEGYIETSPMHRVRRPESSPARKRTLTSEELCALVKAVSPPTRSFHRIAMLLLLTGQRRGEIAALEWDWVDLDERIVTLPAHFTKNREEHTFPLSRTATSILEETPEIGGSPYVFPAYRGTGHYNGWGKDMAALRKETGHTDYTLHDLRRTVSTGLAQIGTPIVVTEKLLNHRSGSRSEIEQIYNRHTYLDEMRQAVEMWEAHIHSHIE